MQGFDVESLIQIQCTIMYGSDSCLERCRALNKLHRNFLVFMLPSEGHNILHYPRSLTIAQAGLPGGSHKHLRSISLSRFPSSHSSLLSPGSETGSETFMSVYPSTLPFGLIYILMLQRQNRLGRDHF